MRLTFVQFEDTGKTRKFYVKNESGTPLGRIIWHAPWRRYCFFPSTFSLFDASCLREIIAFIDSEMAKRKAA